MENKQNPIDLLINLSSGELRDRLNELYAQEKALMVLLRAALARERIAKTPDRCNKNKT